MITSTYFLGRVFHTQRDTCYVITDTLQGTSGTVPGMRTDLYPRAGYPRYGGREILPGSHDYRMLQYRGRRAA